MYLQLGRYMRSVNVCASNTAWEVFIPSPRSVLEPEYNQALEMHGGEFSELPTHRPGAVASVKYPLHSVFASLPLIVDSPLRVDLSVAQMDHLPTFSGLMSP